MINVDKQVREGLCKGLIVDESEVNLVVVALHFGLLPRLRLDAGLPELGLYHEHLSFYLHAWRRLDPRQCTLFCHIATDFVRVEPGERVSQVDQRLHLGLVLTGADVNLRAQLDNAAGTPVV